jgi:hypothetical protein
MKIEIDVDPKDLAKSMKEILDTLPPEKRVEIARDTMQAWLKEPYEAERLAKERAVLETLMSKQGYGRKESEKEARSSWEFAEEMKKFRSTKDTMIETITREISASYQAEVKKVVESDPKVQAMKDEVIQIVRETFPKAFHEAMVAWTANNLQMMFETVMGVRQAGEAFQKVQADIVNRLGQVENRMAGRIS